MKKYTRNKLKAHDDHHKTVSHEKKRQRLEVEHNRVGRKKKPT